MKKLIIYPLFLFVLALVTSCEKVIKIDLNSASPQYVIESHLTDNNDELEVIITQTTDYFNPKEPKVVTNATVSLFNQDGLIGNPVYTPDGVYKLLNFTGQQEDTYTLRVEVEEKVFEAKSYLPKLVTIDTLVVNSESDAKFYFQEPVNETNYYRYDAYVNGARLYEEIEAFDDEFVNGDYIDISILDDDFLFEDEEGLVKSGDTLTIVMRSFDKHVYEFYRTRENALNEGDPFSAAPSNPVNNWSNGALGYFEAYSADTKTMVIP